MTLRRRVAVWLIGDIGPAPTGDLEHYYRHQAAEARAQLDAALVQLREARQHITRLQARLRHPCAQRAAGHPCRE